MGFYWSYLLQLPVLMHSCKSYTAVRNSLQQYHAIVPTCRYKFWTCCQRRTSDFNEFLKQEGCTTGDHVWVEVWTSMCSHRKLLCVW